MFSIERPLDLLNKVKGEEVTVCFKGDKEITGILLAFDIHINIVLEHDKKITFFRGDTIESISHAGGKK